MNCTRRLPHRDLGIVDDLVALEPGDDGGGLRPEGLAHQLVVLPHAHEVGLLDQRHRDRTH